MAVNNGKISSSTKWLFSAEQIAATPSRKHGMSAEKELTFRQFAAFMIHYMGKRLQLNLICVNAAIIYMHRFYMYHPFTVFKYYEMAAASLFLATKSQDQRRPPQHIIDVAAAYLMKYEKAAPKIAKDLESDLFNNERFLIRTLDCNLAVDLPYSHAANAIKLFQGADAGMGACRELTEAANYIITSR